MSEAQKNTNNPTSKRSLESNSNSNNNKNSNVTSTDAPPAKKHSSTTDITTGKKFVQLQLPAANPKNVGTFSRDQGQTNDPKPTSVDQDSLETLQRYEKTTNVEKLTNTTLEDDTLVQETSTLASGSQLGSEYYKQLMMRNVRDELTTAESKIVSFKDENCLTDEDLKSVLKDNTNSSKLKVYPHIMTQIELSTTCQFLQTELESYDTSEGNAKQELKKSSQVAIPIIDETMIENKQLINRNIKKFASIDLTTVVPQGFYRDDKYPNCIAVPLKSLLNKTDRPKLIDCGDLHIHHKYFPTNKGRKRCYEVYKVLENHLQTSTTKDIISLFFKTIFQNFDEHIDWMMENKDIHILLIVNREELLEEEELNNTSIIGGVLFACHGTKGISINAIGINAAYRYNSFGPFLIHLAQNIGCYHIDMLTIGRVTCQHTTYLACRPYLIEFYQTIGFCVEENLQQFLKGGEMESFGTHLEIDMWIDFEGEDKQVIMCNRELCYKMRNYITPPKYHIENCLYDQNLLYDQDNCFTVPQAWKSSCEKTFKECNQNILDQSIENFSQVIGEENKFLPSSIYMKHIKQLSLTNIGEMFERCLAIFEGKRREYRNLILKSAVPSLLNLSIILSQNMTENITQRDQVWCQMTCQKCDKSCLIYNTGSDPIVIFLMKCIVSVWYQHVYALKKDDDNEWSKVFPFWSICTKRNGRFLERLKLTNYQDQDNFNNTNSKKQDVAFYELLRTFLESYIDNQKKARECAVSFLCTLWCHQVNSLRNKEDVSTNLLETGMDDLSLHSNNDTETEEEGSTVQQPKKKRLLNV